MFLVLEIIWAAYLVRHVLDQLPRVSASPGLGCNSNVDKVPCVFVLLSKCVDPVEKAAVSRVFHEIDKRAQVAQAWDVCTNCAAIEEIRTW